MSKIDIVMQGPLCSQTYEIAKQYSQHALVNKVIISTWDTWGHIQDDGTVITIYSPEIVNPGFGNRNRQLISSKNGIKYCTADIIVKTRTDQKLESDSIHRMYDYFIANNKIDVKFIDNSGPKGAIFVLGLFTKYPFHPQDHLFWGWREDIIALFDILPDEQIPNCNQITDNSGAYTDYTHSVTRPNTFFGMFYYAKFDTKIQEMVIDYKTYIVDAAPKIQEALAIDAQYRDIIFKAFPKIKLWWYKHNRDYPYDWGAPYSEYHS